MTVDGERDAVFVSCTEEAFGSSFAGDFRSGHGLDEDGLADRALKVHWLLERPFDTGARDLESKSTSDRVFGVDHARHGFGDVDERLAIQTFRLVDDDPQYAVVVIDVDEFATKVVGDGLNQ